MKEVQDKVEREHTETVPDAMCHMDLSENVTWMLGEVVKDVDYPMEVTVTVEVEHVAE